MTSSSQVQYAPDLPQTDNRPIKTSSEEEKSTFCIFREVVESLVVAFILAMLFRTFQAEAFVIPTGSMANTLMGRHKDLTCPECGFRFKVGASREVDRETGREIQNAGLEGVMCPNCRIGIDLTSEAIAGRNHPSYGGDRIVVGKYPYHISSPKRWDVFVFMYPGNTRDNYIKRLVGLPGETLRIAAGNLYTRPLEDKGTDKPFSIARKPPEKILATMCNVYDNDLSNEKYYNETQAPRRWTSGAGSVWEKLEKGIYNSKSTDPNSINWLVYQHIVPTYDSLINYYRHSKPYNAPDYRPSLITDVNAYNCVHPRDAQPTPWNVGVHWVGDLIVECTVKPEQKKGKVHLKLVKGGVNFSAVIDLENEQATLGASCFPDFKPKASINVKEGKPMKLRFANVDDALYLWVNDKIAAFDATTEYSNADNDQPTPDDLAPVYVGVEGVNIQLSHLKLFRDLYYIAAPNPSPNRFAMNDFKNGLLPYDTSSAKEMEDFYRNPSRWLNHFADRNRLEFDLDKGQYFAMGDNSSHSEDGRFWENKSLGTPYYVDESLIIGKAYYVFWPHVLNGYIPNIADMRRIR